MSLTERQKAFRRTGITATDIRTLAGCYSYGRTAHDVWAAKVLGHDDFADTEATELGNALEPIVIPRLARKVGMHVLPVDPELLTSAHPDHPTHIATPDALLAPTRLHDVEATAQVKCVGLHDARDWGEAANDVGDSEAIPEHVLVQDVWEAYVRRVALSFVGLFLGTEIRAYRIVRTSAIGELEEALIEVADRFWTDHVLTKTPPPVDGSEGAKRMVAARWPRNNGVVIPASREAEAEARAYFEARALKKQAEEAMALASQRLRMEVADGDGLKGDGWRLFVKERAAAEVPGYTRDAYRHFDLQQSKGASK